MDTNLNIFEIYKGVDNKELGAEKKYMRCCTESCKKRGQATIIDPFHSLIFTNKHNHDPNPAAIEEYAYKQNLKIIAATHKNFSPMQCVSHLT